MPENCTMAHFCLGIGADDVHAVGQGQPLLGLLFAALTGQCGNKHAVMKGNGRCLIGKGQAEMNSVSGRDYVVKG